MKHILLLLSLTVTAEIPASWLRAIPDDVESVTGIDVVRFHASEIRKFQRLDVPLEDTNAIQYMVHVEYDSGNFYLLRMDEPASKEVLENYFLVAFDKETAVLGRPDAVAWALERLRGKQGSVAPVRDLADRYDAWAYSRSAMPERSYGIAPASLRFQTELLDTLRSGRLGIRFGATLEARLEVETKTAEQASALAVLGRLVLGFAQNRDLYFNIDPHLLNAIDRFTTRAEGATAIAEAFIPVSAFAKIEERQ